MELEKTGAELTPEKKERLAEHRQKKAAQHKARMLKELAAAQKEGEALTPEESERLEAHKSWKKTARKSSLNKLDLFRDPRWFDAQVAVNNAYSVLPYSIDR